MGNIIKAKKQKWVDFYESKKSGAMILITQDYGSCPLPYPENKDKRIEYALNMYKMRADALDVDDDSIPYLSPYTGTELFAHAFGCDVYYPGNDMPAAIPFINNSAEAAKISYPDLKSSPVIAEVFEIADKLRSYAPGALMRLPDIQSPLDVAALIWNKTDFFAAMYEEPEAVLNLVEQVEKFQTEFLDLWFGRYGRDFIAHYPDYYMPRGITFSEDEVGCFSPEMFRKFSLDSLNRLSERYGMAGMHCCADAKHQWENFKLIKNLKLINIGQSYEVCQEAYKYFEDTCAQMHYAYISDEIWRDNKNMRVIVQEYAGSKQEAVEKCKRLREKYEV